MEAMVGRRIPDGLDARLSALAARNEELMRSMLCESKVTFSTQAKALEARLCELVSHETVAAQSSADSLDQAATCIAGLESRLAETLGLAVERACASTVQEQLQHGLLGRSLAAVGSKSTSV